MQDNVTRHRDTGDDVDEGWEIVVLVGQTHVHSHASWLYQRPNLPDCDLVCCVWCPLTSVLGGCLGKTEPGDVV